MMSDQVMTQIYLIIRLEFTTTKRLLVITLKLKLALILVQVLKG